MTNRDLFENFSHVRWVREIGDFLKEDDFHNIVKFSLAYTLQSIRAGENLDRFKWDDNI